MRHAVDPRAWPIRWRLTALNVGVLALTLALLGGALLLQLDSALITITTDHLRDQARLALFHWIEGFYNSRRRHSTLGHNSPDRFEEAMKREREEDLETAVAG